MSDLTEGERVRTAEEARAEMTGDERLQRIFARQAEREHSERTEAQEAGRVLEDWKTEREARGEHVITRHRARVAAEAAQSPQEATKPETGGDTASGALPGAESHSVVIVVAEDQAPRVLMDGKTVPFLDRLEIESLTLQAWLEGWKLQTHRKVEKLP